MTLDPDLVRACIHCGFCLPTCPTYLLWGEEMDSPRGRIALMRQSVETGSDLAAGAPHFDRCLGCMACLTSCPSGVRYDRLIEAVRPQVEQSPARTRRERAFRRLCFEVFTHPKRLRLVVPLAGLARRLRLADRLSRFPRLASMARLAPAPAPPPVLSSPDPNYSGEVTTNGAKSGAGRVGLLQGCAARVFFAGVNEATLRVLTAEGYDVTAPEAPRCCGALHLHSGEVGEATALAKETIEAFEGHDLVTVNAAGCGSAMKEYADLLAGDPAWAERARAFVAKVRDVSEILASAPPRAPRHPVEATVAYHDACHLAHAQKIRSQPRALLTQIPGLQVREPAEWEICCGSAGIYNVFQPDTARDLGRRKAANLLATGAELIAAGNPGCTLQISAHLDAAGSPRPVVHPIELLDWSIRGVGLPAPGSIRKRYRGALRRFEWAKVSSGVRRRARASGS
jgi:glycolate oxidase iron-sulfur subunit